MNTIVHVNKQLLYLLPLDKLGERCMSTLVIQILEFRKVLNMRHGLHLY